MCWECKDNEAGIPFLEKSSSIDILHTHIHPHIHTHVCKKLWGLRRDQLSPWTWFWRLIRSYPGWMTTQAEETVLKGRAEWAVTCLNCCSKWWLQSRLDKVPLERWSQWLELREQNPWKHKRSGGWEPWERWKRSIQTYVRTRKEWY